MKFKYIIYGLIALLLIAAWVTKPTSKSFNDYFSTHSKAYDNAPLIVTEDKFLYTVNKVTVYQAVQSGVGKQVAVPVVKETYIGLFGKFWKLD